MTRQMFGATCHSSKRRAEEEPEGDHPITKRLAQMRIGQEKQEGLREGILSYHQDRPHLQTSITSPVHHPNGSSPDDLMFVDDTKDKVYIRDLESEIAQIEAEEPRGIFLPDIDRRISAIPQQLLQNQTNNANSQMVLYQVPSSISVPEDQDHVRKAIIATRARAREEQARKAEEGKKNEQHVPIGNVMNGFVPDGIGEEQNEDDPDAMDLG
jgi:hypothetical protein